MSRLELRNVTKSFGGVRAVDGVSLDFDGGRVSGLIGPNGAGKTTVFNLITGLVSPTEGDIYYNGRSISRLAPWRVAHLGIGRLFQDGRVFERLTVLDNIMTAFKGQRGESALLSVVARGRVKAEERVLRRRAQEELEFVGLAHKTEELAANLSYGQQKLLALARLLAAEMDVLLLDEPTAGVEREMVGRILGLIRRVAEVGKNVVVIEHNVGVVNRCADVVFFLDGGRVAARGEPGEMLRDPRIRAAFLGV
jgi:ABC-type branched-subunit amino acid transport system ATPase component